MVVTKLFRSPQDAVRAVSLLKQKGFVEGEVSILAQSKGTMEKLFRGKVPHLSRVDSVVASGPLVTALSGSNDLVGGLVKALGISVEKAEYYQLAVSLGGVLVAVNVPEPQAKKAREVLREAESVWGKLSVQERSPGFVAASRMSATNPVDAPMSGDFRKY